MHPFSARALVRRITLSLTSGNTLCHNIHCCRQIRAASAASSSEAVYTVDKRVRMDAFLSEALPDVSRARIKTSIEMGLVLVNGAAVTKASYNVKTGDRLQCRLPPPPLSSALAEDIPLDIVYEDESVIVINKRAGVVVHPSPGHESGTLVNALLHHCGLGSISVLGQDAAVPASLEGVSVMQAMQASRDRPDVPAATGGTKPDDNFDRETNSFGAELVEDDDDDDSDVVMPLMTQATNYAGALMRPGIVHRLDKGTTGLLVVAKDDSSLTSLGAQFKAREVRRLYLSITVGVPPKAEGSVETNIWRHMTERKKMSVYGYGSDRGRIAISTYKVIEELAGGTAALVQWRLQTGRTHQIRVHAQHLGCPLLADEDYGGTGLAYSVIGRGHKVRDPAIRRVVKQLGRPALHARTLGFKHPESGEQLDFSCDVPADFSQALQDLRALPSIT